MNDQTLNTQQAPDSRSMAMIITLSLIATISGLLIVLVYEWTKPVIEANRQALIEAAIFDVIPGSTQRQDLVIEDGGKRSTVYAAYNEKGELRGIAAEAAAQGYSGIIRLLYAYDHTCQCIIGVRVLQLSETPGIGDKIIDDPRFHENFSALDSRLDAAGEALANPIVTVRAGKKTEAWQIDAISGATISSEAVGRALRENTEWLLPRLLPRLEEIKALPQRSQSTQSEEAQLYHNDKGLPALTSVISVHSVAKSFRG